MHGINCENIKMRYSYGYFEDGAENTEETLQGDL